MATIGSNETISSAEYQQVQQPATAEGNEVDTLKGLAERLRDDPDASPSVVAAIEYALWEIERSKRMRAQSDRLVQRFIAFRLQEQVILPPDLYELKRIVDEEPGDKDNGS